MSMPETAINQDYLPSLREDYVGFAGKGGNVNPIAITELM